VKISRIDIKDYNRFKNIIFDLTYPQGHEKQGKPLDKVCIIGQSGTGKTNLLNIFRTVIASHQVPEMKKVLVESEYGGVSIISEITDGKITQDRTRFNKEFSALERKKLLQRHYGDSTALVHFPSEIPTRTKIPTPTNPAEEEKEVSTTVKKPPSGKTTTKAKSEKIVVSEPKIFDFEKTDISAAWQVFLKDIDAFKAEEERLTQQIVTSLASSIDASERSFAKFKQWKKDHINPIENLARALDPVLEAFYVKVKTDIKPDDSQRLKFVELQTSEDIDLSYSNWSAGVKQFILTAVPLFKLDTKNAVILIDEPEKSLYPDIQDRVVHYYRQLCPNAQFFMATHSPFIASAFEPWEIIELKFDEQGKVSQELYYNGERHVQNFQRDLYQLYWRNFLPEVAEENKENLTDKELASISRLKVKLRKLKENNKIDTKEAKKTLKEFEKLVAKLSGKV